MTRKKQRRFVPCSGCTLCCEGDAVKLEPEDMQKNYITEIHPYIKNSLMIAHKPNGDCIYLLENGCSIHDKAPSLCRSADCRSLALKFDFTAAMRLHRMKRIN
jgi:Fe-S-cluster containining protein